MPNQIPGRYCAMVLICLIGSLSACGGSSHVATGGCEAYIPNAGAVTLPAGFPDIRLPDHVVGGPATQLATSAAAYAVWTIDACAYATDASALLATFQQNAGAQWQSADDGTRRCQRQ